ncbi:hypothetical protein RDMS_04845 [Deinococcus sp. RL]|uniref:DUF262 and DUF1524 domain-containing protein n=1 Tax=Deinococcus sp. RL TaxID=1489678 RepID=UPI0004D8DB23|nr:DUF262 and DUF1524 domain-containing protein [Deinococcus sp. RL]KEF34847.1 hypothetical protein RDMS_04845 [Deinococcus sp. RL]
MKAKESKLLKFLQGEKQFHVPIYQRTYSWLRPQCEQYWHDLLTAGRDATVEAHFLGAVVYIGRGIHQVSDVSQYLVIDGQQRLTTTSLLLLALARHLGPSGEIVLTSEADDGSVSETRITAARIRENHLINRHEDGGDGFYKLLLTQSDRETLRRLLDGGPLPDTTSPRVLENLRFFEERLGDEDVDLRDVYRGLQKLVIVDVALEQGKDNPQLIFESMNSTGLDLTQADLIRNFVLMGLEPKAQTKLYTGYWKPMEDRFAGRDPQDFDRFVRDYLSLRVPTNTPARLDQVYAAFKRYALGHKDTGALVQDLAEMSRYYAAILDPAAVEKDADVRRALLDVAALKLEVAFPFLLQVYADWQQGVIGKPEFLQVLRLTESYLFRRSICGINSQGLNKLFPDLPRRIDPTDYVQSLQDALFDLKTYLRFPRDGEFREALAHRDLYQVKRLCGYALLKLENFEHKEPISLGGLTIEHVLPQTENLAPEWQAMLGPDAERIQSRYLHTLGNLTLTGYNSELSARPFAEKRDMKGGFKDSHLRLNADLAKLDEWNEAQIQARAERLAALAVRVWQPLEPSEEARARADEKGRKPPKVERSVEDHLQGASTELRELFEDVREGLLNLHEDAVEHPLAVYIGYKVGTNFCDLTVQAGANNLRCWLNLPYGSLVDATGRVRDVSQIGHHGNGDAEVILRPGDDVEWFLGLAGQALAYQVARHQSAPSSVQQRLEQLPAPVREVFSELERRVLALAPDVTVKRNKWYLSYRQHRAFFELKPLVDSLTVWAYVDEDGAGIPEADRPSWEPTKWPKWWRRRLRTAVDLNATWPAVQFAFETLAQQALESPKSVRPRDAGEQTGLRATYAALVQAVEALGPSLAKKVTNKGTFFYVKGAEGYGQHIIRIHLHSPRGLVEVLVALPFSEVDDPSGRGYAREQHTSMKRGHFSIDLHSGEEALGLHVLRQVCEHHVGAGRA